MPISKEAFEGGEERYSIENEMIRFLHENRDRAYNVREIAVEVMDPGWSESNLDPSDDAAEFMGCVLDLATVNTIADGLVDNGALERRIVDAGEGERSYYRGR